MPYTPMPRKILVLQGHPDASRHHLCHMLADAYKNGAEQAGHVVRTVNVTTLDCPLLRSKEAWDTGEVPDTLSAAQQCLQWADHVVVVFPLWLGGMPGVLRVFLEQVLRPGFAIGRTGRSAFGTKLLRGRSARVIVTMGMPALVYRWYFRAHGLKVLERNILAFVGLQPVRSTVVGSVEDLSDKRRRRVREAVEALGRAAR